MLCQVCEPCATAEMTLQVFARGGLSSLRPRSAFVERPSGKVTGNGLCSDVFYLVCACPGDLLFFAVLMCSTLCVHAQATSCSLVELARLVDAFGTFSARDTKLLNKLSMVFPSVQSAQTEDGAGPIMSDHVSSGQQLSAHVVSLTDPKGGAVEALEWTAGQYT